MKKVIIALLLALALGPVGANAAVFVKYDGVDGESTDSSTDSETTRVEIVPISAEKTSTRDDGEDDGSSSGNVEAEWKIEEGESAAVPGVEPDEIDAPAMEGDAEITLKAQEEEEERGGTEDMNIGIGELQESGLEPDEIDSRTRQRTNFALLLSSGGEDNEDEGLDVDSDNDGAAMDGVEPEEIDLAADGGAEMLREETMMRKMDADSILSAVQETTDVPIEIVQLNHEEEELEAEVRHTVRLFGFIPVETRAHVTIDAEERIKVKFPWWAFFAGGKDREGLGDRVFSAILSVL